jgi:hypothetical protein
MAGIKAEPAGAADKVAGVTEIGVAVGVGASGGVGEFG